MRTLHLHFPADQKSTTITSASLTSEFQCVGSQTSEESFSEATDDGK